MMGAKPSRGSTGLMAPGCGLKFTTEQLENLNAVFYQLLMQCPQSKRREYDSNLVSLAKAICCGVGKLDQRFKSKWIVAPFPIGQGDGNEHDQTYFVHLENWNTHNDANCDIINDVYPCCNFIEGPTNAVAPGFARLRMQGGDMEDWLDLLSPGGYVCSQRVLERFYELVSDVITKGNVTPCAGKSQLSPESSGICVCHTPLLDAATFQEMLTRLAPKHQLLLIEDKPVKECFTDLWVEMEEGSVVVRTNMGKNIRLVPMLAFQGWPTACDFPLRVHLGHYEILRILDAVNLGFLCIPNNDNSVSPDLGQDRDIPWTLDFSPCTAYMLRFLAPHAATSSVLRCLRLVTAQLSSPVHPLWHSRQSSDASDTPPRLKLQSRLRVLTPSVITHSFLFALETLPEVDSWKWSDLSSNVIAILDSILISLSKERMSNYYITEHDVMWKPWLEDEDYLNDSGILRDYIKSLFELSACEDNKSYVDTSTRQSLINKIPLENSLLGKWRTLHETSVPVNINAASFCKHHIEYVALIITGIGKVLDSIREAADVIDLRRGNAVSRSLNEIVGIIMTQLEEAPIRTHPSDSGQLQLIAQALINEVSSRFVSSSPGTSVERDEWVARSVIAWLEEAGKTRPFGILAKKYLRKLLLAATFNTPFMHNYLRKRNLDELHSLKSFCSILSSEEIKEANLKLKETAWKGWKWANKVIAHPTDDIECYLVVLTDDSRTLRFPLQQSQNFTVKKSQSVAQKYQDDVDYLEVLLHSHQKVENGTSLSMTLREANPVVFVLNAIYIPQYERGMGNVIKALVGLRKFAILREVSALLPEPYKRQALGAIQRLSRGCARTITQALKLTEQLPAAGNMGTFTRRSADYMSVKKMQQRLFQNQKNFLSASQQSLNEMTPAGDTATMKVKKRNPVKRSKSLQNLFRRSSAEYPVSGTKHREKDRIENYGTWRGNCTNRVSASCDKGTNTCTDVKCDSESDDECTKL